MVGVCVGTAALVVVLSVFNGLEDLTRTMFRRYNPELKISATQGKAFEVPQGFVNRLERIPHVAAITEVIEDNALLRYQEEQLIVNAKGVSDNFLQQYDLSPYLVSGTIALYEGSTPRALLGAGVAYQLSVSLSNLMVPLQMWYPKRDRKLSLNPERAFYRQAILPAGIFALEQSSDYNAIIVPIAFMEELLKYEGRRTSLEVKVTSPTHLVEVQKEIRATLGDTFIVETAEEQQATVLRAVKIERLFGFFTFALILGIASFNVFFSLAMLAIEKRRDIAILFSMGATAALVRRIFLWEGLLIALIGGGLGLLLGFLICYIQQTFGIVKLGVTSSIVEAYPVKMQMADFVFSGITVIAITLLAAFLPAHKASKVSVSQHL